MIRVPANGLRYVTPAREELAAFRDACVPGWMKTLTYQRLEREYGKYLFVPMDISVKPNDPQRFKDWFLRTAKPVYKNAADIASPDQTERYAFASFLSIDSKETLRTPSVWDRNPVSDLYEQFPEIKEAINALPFGNLQVYCLWSSQYQVSPHRDATPLLDLPFAFRIKLYDENPVETLSLHKGLPNTNFSKCEKRKLAMPPGSNVFAWNNLRLLHSSVKMNGRMKILMIVAPSVLNLPDTKRFEEVIKAGATKFPEYTWVDNEPLTSYITEASSYLVPWQRRAYELQHLLPGRRYE